MKYTCNIQLKLIELCCKSSPSTSCYPFFFSKNHADYNLSAQYLHHVSVRTVIAVFCKLLDKYYALLCYRWVTIRDSFIIIKYSMPLTSRSLLARWPISLPLACVFHMYMLRITQLCNSMGSIIQPSLNYLSFDNIQEAKRILVKGDNLALFPAYT